MKTHAIIPIFVPHSGCPNDCVFCNQRAITAHSQPPTIDEARQVIERNLATITRNPNITRIEIAFFGGSFTGIPMEEQTAYLELAQEYLDAGQIHAIHLSTRPDYITPEILDNLKAHGVSVIELGVQSFDPDVLRLSNRGHSAEIVAQSASLIKEYGFTLGIQLMIGLPGDSFDKCMYSVNQAIALKPAIARIYPTVVLSDTQLCQMAEEGSYQPLSQEDAVRTAKEMYKTLTAAGINVIRVGLKSTDVISTDSPAIGAGGYHPAFRQLVEAEIAKEMLEVQLLSILSADGILTINDTNTCETIANDTITNDTITGDITTSDTGTSDAITIDTCTRHPDNNTLENSPAFSATKIRITFTCHPSCFSNMIGNKKSNKIYFEGKYPAISFRFAIDDAIAIGRYTASIVK